MKWFWSLLRHRGRASVDSPPVESLVSPNASDGRRCWFVSVRQKPAYFWKVMERFSDTGAHVSLEGKLKDTGILDHPKATPGPTDALPRNSCYRDMIILPIEPDVIASLKQAFSHRKVFSGDGILDHMQVELQGKLVVSAIDNFSREGISVWEPIDEEFLRELRQERIIRAFGRHPLAG